MIGSPLAAKVVNEALALRTSHPQAPAIDILDLVMRGRGDLWLADLFEHMVPPSPFALLVAEAMHNFTPTPDWRVVTGPDAEPALRDAMRQSYAQTMPPRFIRRYGFSWPWNDRPMMQAVFSELQRRSLDRT